MTERSELEVRLDQLCAGQVEQRADHKHLDECVDTLKQEVRGLRDEIRQKHSALMKFIISALVSLALIEATALIGILG